MSRRSSLPPTPFGGSSLGNEMPWSHQIRKSIRDAVELYGANAWEGSAEVSALLSELDDHQRLALDLGFFD